MKFTDIVDLHLKKLITEQDAPPPEAAVPGDGPQRPEQAAEPAEPAEPDVPAGIATMGSLLKKALTMKLSDEDRYSISKLPEINERNANEIINQIIAIMKSYSADIDIDNNSKTTL
jgi:hypothetical protein